MEMDRNPWESVDSSTDNSVSGNPWDLAEKPKEKTRANSGLGDMSTMSLAGALKSTPSFSSLQNNTSNEGDTDKLWDMSSKPSFNQAPSPFKQEQPSTQPSLDLISPRNQTGNLGEEDLIKMQAEEARANVQALYGRYSTLGNRALSVFGNDEATAKVKADANLIIKKGLEELRAQGIAADYRDGQFYAYDDQGKEIPLEDVSLLKTINKSKWEAFGGAALGTIGGVIGGGVGTVGGPAGTVGGATLGRVGGTFLGAAIGSYAGVKLGSGLDGVLAEMSMASKVDDGTIYKKMDDAGIADIVTGGLALPIAKGAGYTGSFIKKIYDFVLAKNQAGAVKAIMQHTGVDEIEAKRRVKALEDLVGPLEGLNDKEKILYTLTQTQRGGEAIADAAAKLDPLASTRLANQISQRAEGVLNAAKDLSTSNNQYIFNQALDSYTKEVKDYYKAVKSAPEKVTEDFRFNLEDLNIQGIIDDIDNGISNPYIKQRFQDNTKLINDAYEGKTFNDLIDLRQAINDIKFNGPKLKSKENELLNNVIKRIDTEIDTAAKTHIPDAENWLNSWSKAKTEYAQMKELESNVMYKALTRPGISEDQVVNIFSKYIKAGDNTFYQVMDKIRGTNNFRVVNRIEGSVLNKLVNQHADGIEGSRRVINFPALSDEIRKVQWQSPEAKQLTRTINRMAEVFKNDVHLAAVTGKIQLPKFQSYLTADPVIRLKMEIASSAFNTVKRLLPTKTADTLAMANNVARLLENPLSSKSINELKRARPMERRGFRTKLDYEDDLNNLQQMYIQRKQAMQQMFNKDIPPRLVWRADPSRLDKLRNPEATILPSVDDVLHVSSQGNIARNRELVWDYESQQTLNTRASDLITEFIWKNTQSKNGEAITEAAVKYMDDSRFTKIMQNAASRLRKEDIEANAKVVANSIRSEAGILIKRIEKDFGVKMPKAEAEKLVALKYKEIMENCNGK